MPLYLTSIQCVQQLCTSTHSTFRSILIRIEVLYAFLVLLIFILSL